MGHGFSIADITFIDFNEHIGAIFCMISHVQLMFSTMRLAT
jgi:hypothetical protein